MLTVVIFVGVLGIVGLTGYLVIRPRAIEAIEDWQSERDHEYKVKIVEMKHKTERERAEAIVLSQLDQLADRDRKAA